MDKMPAYYIFLGLLVGAAFGAGVGAVNGNAIHGMELGALVVCSLEPCLVESGLAEEML